MWKNFTITNESPRTSDTRIAKRNITKKLSSTNIKKLANESCYKSRELEKELTKILHDCHHLQLFREFLKSKHSEENLYFWIEVELFKNDKLTSSDKLQPLAEKKYIKYIIDGAPLQINIESEYFERIRQNVKNKIILINFPYCEPNWYSSLEDVEDFEPFSFFNSTIISFPSVCSGFFSAREVCTLTD